MQENKVTSSFDCLSDLELSIESASSTFISFLVIGLVTRYVSLWT